MTDLSRLRVSLTKHNAHKVAQLLKAYEAEEVFDKLDEVGAERAQARKNLSTLTGDILPDVWGKAKGLSEDAIDALVLVAIIFSHHSLIEAMQGASDRQGFSGRIERGNQLDGKAYTNFVQIVDSLGYSTKREYEGINFNLKGIFEIPGLAPLVSELLELKLNKAGWERSNTLAEEAGALGFEQVFGLTSDELTQWLTSSAKPAAAGSALLPKDEEFFQDETEGSNSKEFDFKPGHIDRDVDPLTRSASNKSKANRLHNDIQNKLYAFLKGTLGADHVGTEIDTGSGTAIDLVTQHSNLTTFFEIKTAASVRSSIRQAIPQLLEYAYWNANKQADQLVIVSHLPINKDAQNYIDFLAKEFKIPLSYKQFDLNSNTLC